MNKASGERAKVTGKKTEKHREVADVAEIAGTLEEQKNKILSLESEIEGLKQSLTEQIEAKEKNLESWRRAEADFSNYRRRTEQEKGEINHSATCSVVYNILPVIDDFERAIASIPEEAASSSWAQGMYLIHKKLRSALESMGVEEVCAIGQVFDPRLHEAVAHLEGDEGAVIKELQKGYKLKDKLIRPSRVVVGKGKAVEDNSE